jgi:hypothetical protein
MTLPPAVLWIDPGKMTGLALFTRHPYTFQAWEQGFIPAGDSIEHLCRVWNHQLAIGWEQFTVGPHTPGIDAHHAIEMIGVARRAAIKNRCQILTAATQEQRKIATQQMLESLGWWVPSADDAQSAACHMLAWMMRTGNEPDNIKIALRKLRG